MNPTFSQWALGLSVPEASSDRRKTSQLGATDVWFSCLTICSPLPESARWGVHSLTCWLSRTFAPSYAHARAVSLTHALVHSFPSSLTLGSFLSQVDSRPRSFICLSPFLTVRLFCSAPLEYLFSNTVIHCGFDIIVAADTVTNMLETFPITVWIKSLNGRWKLKAGLGWQQLPPYLTSQLLSLVSLFSTITIK